MQPQQVTEPTRHRFGCLEILSSVGFSELPAAPFDSSALTQIRLDVGHDVGPPIEREIFGWPGRYGLTLNECASGWLMSSTDSGSIVIDAAGRLLSWHFRGDEPDTAARDFLVRRVLPRITLLHRATVIHGAAVSNGTHALLLLGSSGAGKSTLCAALAHEGWHVLSDDLSMLRDDDGPTVWSGATGVCLWPDSRAALNLSEDRSRELPNYGDKHCFMLDASQSSSAYPLHACVMLSRSTTSAEASLLRVPALDGVLGITSQLIRFNPVDPTERIELLLRLNALLESVAVYRLTYPDRFDALPRTIARLREAFP
jgi:hypothetical protein